MIKEEKFIALFELAQRHPYDEYIGYKWKNPLNNKSKGIRWRKQDIEQFRKFQKQIQVQIQNQYINEYCN